MKITFGKTVISPEIGTKVAGYGTEDYSVAKLDDLYVTDAWAMAGKRMGGVVADDIGDLAILLAEGEHADLLVGETVGNALHVATVRQEGALVVA